ncbi:hypothetical protein A0U95_00625 [Pseudomonas brassicacearum]|nr:hypothetical protein A0U95_00625 [Pseudomonas brassicacearum]
MTKVVNQAMATADGPDVVAEVVLQIARAERPKLRYTAGKAAGQLQFMRSFCSGTLAGNGHPQGAAARNQTAFSGTLMRPGHTRCRVCCICRAAMTIL